MPYVSIVDKEQFAFPIPHTLLSHMLMFVSLLKEIHMSPTSS